MKTLTFTSEDTKVFACLWTSMLTAKQGISTPMITKFNRVMQKLEDISIGNEDSEEEVVKTLSAKLGTTVLIVVVVNRKLNIEDTVEIEFEDEDFNFMYKRVEGCDWNALLAKHAEQLIKRLKDANEA